MNKKVIIISVAIIICIITLIAIFSFQPKEYTVRFLYNDGTVNEMTINEGNVIKELEAPQIDDYTFVGWTLNGTLFDFSSVVTDNVTLIATYEKNEEKVEIKEEEQKKEYIVIFDTVGGSNVVEQKVKEGECASKPSDPTKSGYTFTGWTLNGSAYNFGSAVNGNITLKASWKQKEYTASVTKVDDYSTDRYITIYEEGVAITVNGIYYTNGTRIPTAVVGNKLSVAAVEMSGVTTIKVQLSSGSMVTATIR